MQPQLIRMRTYVPSGASMCASQQRSVGAYARVSSIRAARMKRGCENLEEWNFHKCLVVREYFDARRSDVSKTGLVQANGEVSRPANRARNKVMVCHIDVKRARYERTNGEKAYGVHEECGEAGERRMQVGTGSSAVGRTGQRRQGSSGRC
jgi:hypothetical protein